VKTERRQGPAQPIARQTGVDRVDAERDAMTMNAKQRALTERVQAASCKLASLKKTSTADERAELLATCPNMPASTRLVLATASIDVVRQAVKDHLAGSGSTRSAERAEMDRKMGIKGPAPTLASVRSGRSQSFPLLTADAAKKLIRAGR